MSSWSSVFLPEKPCLSNSWARGGFVSCIDHTFTQCIAPKEILWNSLLKPHMSIVFIIHSVHVSPASQNVQMRCGPPAHTTYLCRYILPDQTCPTDTGAHGSAHAHSPPSCLQQTHPHISKVYKDIYKYGYNGLEHFTKESSKIQTYLQRSSQRVDLC